MIQLMRRHTLILLAAAAALQGCTTSYHCNKFPEGSCSNMSQIYDSTGNGWQDYRDHPAPDDKGSSSGKAGDKRPPIVIGETTMAANQMVPGDPVLTNPQAMRVMVMPWEDKGKALNYSYIWLITRDPQWTQLQ